jgi:hypothetical protein
MEHCNSPADLAAKRQHPARLFGIGCLEAATSFVRAVTVSTEKKIITFLINVGAVVVVMMASAESAQRSKKATAGSCKWAP